MTEHMENEGRSVTKRNCVFGLCVKDNANSLPRAFANIAAVRDLFDTLQIVAFYDKSQDGSLEVLQNSASRYGLPLCVINTDDSDPQMPTKTGNVSRARNGILDWIRSPNGAGFELFVMMDTHEDGCRGDIIPEVLEKYLSDEWFDKYDGLVFNHKPYHDYPSLSLGNFETSTRSYPTVEIAGFSTVTDYKKGLENCFESRLKTAKDNGELLEVESAFGGFGLYKTESYVNSRYAGQMVTELFDTSRLATLLMQYPVKYLTNADSEHRPFHYGARKEGKKLRMATECLFTSTESQ